MCFVGDGLKADRSRAVIRSDHSGSRSIRRIIKVLHFMKEDHSCRASANELDVKNVPVPSSHPTPNQP